MSSSTALTKRSADHALMPPPPPPKRIKRPPKVLDEDTYTAALSHIIARDFFPGLLETKSQQDYLNALEAGDEEWINEAEKKVLEVMGTPRYGRGRRGVSLTPRWDPGQDTPRNLPPSETPKTPKRGSSSQHHQHQQQQAKDDSNQEQEDVDLDLSLSAFQAKYTSEDNESFNKVIDKQNATRAQKHVWMWNGNRIPSARQIAYAAREQRLLKSGPSPSSSQAVALRPSQNLDDRPASITVKPTTNPRNSLMFDSGDDISVTHPQLTTVAEAAQARSNAPPKSVSYASTRLQTDLNDPNANTTTDDDDIPPSPSLSAIDAAIAGFPRHRSISTAASSIDGNETPRVNGYAFVDAEPTPSEVSALPDQATAFQASMASSTRAAKANDRRALLRRLIQAGRDENDPYENNDNNNDSNRAGVNSGVNPFSIRESSRRETLHHRMVDKQLASKRSSSSSHSRPSTPQYQSMSTKTPTATPKFSSAPHLTPASSRNTKKLETLTPAAQQLYERVGRTPSRQAMGNSPDSRSKDKGVFAIDFTKAVGRERDKEKQKRAWTPAQPTPGAN